MRVKEITIEQIKKGENWKVVDPAEFQELELEDLAIAVCRDFSPEDHVVYSSIFVSDAGEVTPTITIKEVGTPEHGGDMCQMKDGKWERTGADPNPDLQIFGNEYVANPLSNDPSFDTGDPSDDERSYNREGFSRWIKEL